MDKIPNQRPGKALFPGFPGNTSFYQDPDKIHKTAQRNHLNLPRRFIVDGAGDLESQLLPRYTDLLLKKEYIVCYTTIISQYS